MTDFTTHGHPGRWAGASLVSGSGVTFDATGSMYGIGAIMITKALAATGSVLLSKGGTIDLQDLNAGTLYELSVQQLKITGSAYLLGRNNYASP